MKRFIIYLLGALALTGLATPGSAEDFDLDALIEAAKGEEPITVYSSTGKIKTSAAAFMEIYGIEVVGTKVPSSAQIEMIIREAQSQNIVGDVILSSDAASTLAEVVPSGIVVSWVPPDLADTISEDSQNPLVVYRDPAVWSYNSDKYDECPVDNVWALTESDWSRKVAMSDPLNKPGLLDWFNQMETHWDQAVADAYESHYGKALDTSGQSATASWIQALAANSPLLTDSDQAAAEAIGTPGQDDPFMGLVSTAKYRDVLTGKLTMKICADIQPFVGYANPAYGLISVDTDSPNLARLFIRFMMTEEGVAPMTRDGKVSGNSAVPRHPEEPSGVNAYSDQLTPHNAATGSDDFDKRQDWQDFWRLSYKR
jgi:iron(III) transport system substrate-binding protein